MNKIITALLGAGLLAASLVPAAVAVAPAPPASPADPATRDAHIELTVARTQGETENIRAVSLDCPGMTGKNHPYTSEACADLHTADGDFDRLPGTDRASCSNDAVTVTATGTYRGREVHWAHTYENDCERQLATGLVFEF
ncbi:SSI family serine proteinase inhibitor [Streptomyces sp. NPDC006197]|uniref:SSI family serine proteinase inhibitor n=1 Tax=Streptomyces sp. NPDC006197 TaxID=3156685 RepID=UPI0033A93B05